MSVLLSCHSLSKAHGSRQLFQDVTFGVFKGNQIGLIGPNGSGKSTLLKILADIESADTGDKAAKKNLIVGYVPQTSTYSNESIENVVVNSWPSDSPIPSLERMLETKILLSKMGFKDVEQQASTLSGGWKKRLDIAKELIKKPELLLLDEPTNHLDLEGILWLESFLKQEAISFIVTSHDRVFLKNTTNTIFELNPVYPGGILAVEGNYSTFLEKKEEFISTQMQLERSLSSKVRSEVEWLRQSPKARTTKASARVQEAEKLIEELSGVQSRNKTQKAKIAFDSTERQTRKLLTVKNLCKSINERKLISHLNLTIAPGMRLGIVGPNGSGKTTLLRLLAKEITPDLGTIKYADDLKVVYFDQHRESIPEGATLRTALSPNSDTVVYKGQSIHVNSWAKRFLFSPERLDLPVRQLSGGERARIQIARLMLKPADLLLLDEPTNDLDIQTLETLEESLSEFPGAIILITHDRALLDNLTNCVLGLGTIENSEETPLFSDYSQWEKHQKTEELLSASSKKERKISNPKSSPPNKKLSYKEKKELDEMEEVINKLEKEIETLEGHVRTIDPKALELLQETCHTLNLAQERLDKLYFRWQELENKANEEANL